MFAKLSSWWLCGSHLCFQCTIAFQTALWTKDSLNLLLEMWLMLFLICICHLCFKHSCFRCSEYLWIFCEHFKIPIFAFYFSPSRGGLINSKFLLPCITGLLLCICLSLFVISIFPVSIWYIKSQLKSFH